MQFAAQEIETVVLLGGTIAILFSPEGFILRRHGTIFRPYAGAEPSAAEQPDARERDPRL